MLVRILTIREDIHVDARFSRDIIGHPQSFTLSVLPSYLPSSFLFEFKFVGRFGYIRKVFNWILIAVPVEHELEGCLL